MARTVIDLDDELLASGAKELGTRDREDTIENPRAAFCWVPVHDGAYARAWEVQCGPD